MRWLFFIAVLTVLEVALIGWMLLDLAGRIP